MQVPSALRSSPLVNLGQDEYGDVKAGDGGGEWLAGGRRNHDGSKVAHPSISDVY